MARAYSVRRVAGLRVVRGHRECSPARSLVSSLGHRQVGPMIIPQSDCVKGAHTQFTQRDRIVSDFAERTSFQDGR